jgi:hypothetical protein
MLDILDAILATAAVILGLSLVVQAIQQIIKQMLDLKSSYMRTELLALFSSVAGKKRFSTNLLPLSWLDKMADGFSQRIVQELEDHMATFGLTDLHLLEDVDPAKLKDLVKSLPVAADKSLGTKIQAALKDVDKWFGIAKKAFQEHYERRMKLWSFILAAVVVIAMNANIIDTYSEFARSKPLRETAIALGQRLTSIPRDSLIIETTISRRDSSFTRVASADSAIVKDISGNIARIQAVLEDRSFQIMGWSATRVAELENHTCWENIIHMFLGWAVMILLVSLGAPFWYDFFKGAMGLKQKINKG